MFVLQGTFFSQKIFFSKKLPGDVGFVAAPASSASALGHSSSPTPPDVGPRSTPATTATKRFFKIQISGPTKRGVVNQWLHHIVTHARSILGQHKM